MKFILGWLATAIATAVAVWIVPGIDIVGSVQMPGSDLVALSYDTSKIAALAAFSLFLSLVNIVIKPICKLLGLPLTIITFGLFSLVINIAMLYLASWLSIGMFGTGIYISGILSALGASIIISFVSNIVGSVIAKD